MKKIIFVLVLLVFVFGCTPSGNDNGGGIWSWFGGGNGKSTARHGFGSSSGLSISFVEDQPPKEIPRDRNIMFALKIRNNGVYTIPSGNFMVRVIGLDNNFNPPELQGANSEDLTRIDESGVGGESTVEVGSTTYSPEQMFDDRIINSGDLEVEVCYLYETQVVLDNFWVGAKTSDVSKGSVSSGDNSNAPVHISELEEKGSGTSSGKDGGSTDFSFKIDVVGKGSVVSNCFPSSEEDKKRKVDLNIVMGGVSCYYVDGTEKISIGSGSSIMLNSQNEKIIHCTVPFSGEKPIKTQLQMTLSYNYDEKISVPGFTIRRF